MDDEILKTVHSIFGKGVKIVDCEKTSSVRQEEVLLINGIPVQLGDLAVDDADAIKAALLTGQMPSVDLLNQLLYQAGLLQQSVQLETTLSVNSRMVTTEEVSVSRNGRVLDERTSETKEDYTYQSNKQEIWQPRLRDNVRVKNNIQQNVKDGGNIIQDRNKLAQKYKNLNSFECEANATEREVASNNGCSSKQTEAIDLSKSNTFDVFNKLKTVDTIDYFDDTNDINKAYAKTKPNYELDSNLSASSISNYSTYFTESDATMTALNTDDSTYQLKYTGLPPKLHSTSSAASSILQQLGDKKSSNLSYDSGHDGLFHSISHSVAVVNPAGANSLSSCYDEFISSSCDELSAADVLQLENKPKELATFRKTAQAQNANVLPAKAKKNHVELEEFNDKYQMLPMSNNVNSGSSGSSNASSTSTNNKNNTTKVISKRVNDIATTSSTTATALSTVRNSLTEVTETQQHKIDNDCSKRSYQFFKPQMLVTPQRQKTNEESTGAQYHHQSIDNLLVYCDGDLISGSLETLIVHMVPTCDYYPENSFIFAFLLSARLFIRPHELLSKISTTWELQQSSTSDVVDDVNISNYHHHNTSSLHSTPLFQRKPQSPPTVKMSAGAGGVASDLPTAATYKDQPRLNVSVQQSTQKSAHNCIRLLEEWIETFPYDFRDERLMQQVRILARKCVYIDNSLGKRVSRILQLLVQRLTILEKYEEFLQSIAASEMNSGETQQQQQLPQPKITTGNSISSKGATACNPLGRSSSTDAYTSHSQKLLRSAVNSNQSLLSASASNANSKPIESQQYHTSQSLPITLQQQHNLQQHSKNSHNDGSMNSVNLTLHHLSGTFSSASSVSDVQEIMDVCPSSEQLAHQLTAIELERLSHIGPEEFVQAFSKEYQHSLAMKKSSADSEKSNASNCGVAIMSTSSSSSLSDFKKTRNLESYVQWFNRLSYFTATEIVKYSKKKQRVRVIEYWIETARECFNIGNFNSLMAIIAGLNLAPISRLKKTWSKVQSAKLSVLEHQMDPTSNFNSYRSTLKAALWRAEGATDERERIIIPFFSLFVKDLYFLNEGCSNRLPNNHINFEKCTQLAKQVREFNEWKKVNCPFEKLLKVIMFLQSSTILNENTLSMASFECEPPENTQEKGRYKTLKSETKQQLQQLNE